MSEQDYYQLTPDAVLDAIEQLRSIIRHAHKPERTRQISADGPVKHVHVVGRVACPPLHADDVDWPGHSSGRIATCPGLLAKGKASKSPPSDQTTGSFPKTADERR